MNSIKKPAAMLLVAASMFLAVSTVSARTSHDPVPESNAQSSTDKDSQRSMTPKQALEKLKEGNQRFTSGKMVKRDYLQEVKETSGGQYPFAVLLSCLDSRTSSEIIFDQGIGDIFNARVAGNFVNTDILGSMEFACKAAGAKVILVVGHTSCGAVKGACDHVEMGNLTNVMKEIKPAVESVKNVPGEKSSKNNDFVEAVSKQNVMLAIKEIREKSPILAEMEKNGEIIIAGAMYDISTGSVEFY